MRSNYGDGYLIYGGVKDEPSSSSVRSNGVGYSFNYSQGSVISNGCSMSQGIGNCAEKINLNNRLPININHSSGQTCPSLNIREGVSKSGPDRNRHLTTTLSTSQNNRSSKLRKNDASKRLADQRWRRSMNECLESLRKILAKDILFRDGTKIKKRDCRSRNDLLAKTADLVADLESALNNLCSQSSSALTPSDNLNALRIKFKMIQMQKDKQEATPSSKNR